ncbi:MAG: hypothetical protein ACPGYL_04110, partial [Rhodospirillaceae bacterium]
VGTVTAGSPATISRDTLLYSSTGAWITWPAIAKVIRCVVAGEYSPVFQDEPTDDDIGKLLIVTKPGSGGGVRCVPMPEENPIINGDFAVHQRVQSNPASGVFAADRWLPNFSGSTMNCTRKLFAVDHSSQSGKVVPGNPEFYMQIIVGSTTGAFSHAMLQQRIEDARSFAGETVTVSFYAKADAAKMIAVEFYQYFGVGGTNGTADKEVGIGVQKMPVTTEWTRITVTAAIPALTGVTLGTDDFLGLRLWLDAGTDFNTETDTLGHQSGTFDIADVKIERGAIATPYIRESFARNLERCQRYFYRTQVGTQAPADGAGDFSSALTMTTSNSTFEAVHATLYFPVQMRKAPTITTYNPYSGGTAGQWGTTGSSLANVACSVSPDRVYVKNEGVAGVANSDYHIHLTADAEL